MKGGSTFLGRGPMDERRSRGAGYARPNVPGKARLTVCGHRRACIRRPNAKRSAGGAQDLARHSCASRLPSWAYSLQCAVAGEAVTRRPTIQIDSEGNMKRMLTTSAAAVLALAVAVPAFAGGDHCGARTTATTADAKAGCASKATNTAWTGAWLRRSTSGT